MSAPTPPPPPHHHHSLNADHIFSSNSALLVAAIAFLLLVLLLHLYAKCFLLPHSSPLPPTLPTFPPPPPRQDPPSPTKGGGLDSSAVASIPLFEYVGGALGPLECVICLGAFRDGDVGRALPTCAHRAFHADCIDTWLLSRSTCPVCRAPVTASPAAIESSAVLGAEEESQEEPSSVVIEITGANENENDDRNHEPPLSVQQPSSMGRSLRRMVSRDNRLDRKIYPSCSSSSVANHVQLHDS